MSDKVRGYQKNSNGPGIEPATRPSKPLCGFVEGFSLLAAQSVSADDREALERLLRYGLRAMDFIANRKRRMR